MTPKIKNIILFSGIAISLILVYVFLVKPSPKEDNLTSSNPSENTVSSKNDMVNTEKINQNSMVTKEFLTVLLNVKGLKLDDSIFSDKAFLNLHDSSILLVPTGDEGRANPFAPIGFDSYLTPPIFSTPTPGTAAPVITP